MPRAHRCRHQAVSPQPLSGAPAVAAPPWVLLSGSGHGPCGDCVPAWGGPSGLALPLPLSTPGQRRHSGMPFTPGFVWGPQGHAGGSEGHFSMHSSHGTLSPGLLWAEDSGHVWGSGGPLSLTPAPGHPPVPSLPVPQQQQPNPAPCPPLPAGAAAPARWDGKGTRPGARMGTAPGVLELPLGMAGFWSLGVSPRGGSRAAPASGSERSSFWQGLPRGLSRIPAPPGAGTRRLLSRTVNILCATFFSGTLGAGGGEREAGVRPETFLYTTNFLYIFNFAAT